VDLPTYTNIWRIEKRLYKLYDLRLPMPLPLGQIIAFAGITVPYVLLLTLIGIPFNHNLFWLYVLPPWALTWLATRPVLENKRLPELLASQVRYLSEPGVWCRMAPATEQEEITVTAKVWHRQAAPQPAAAAQPAAVNGAVAGREAAAGPEVSRAPKPARVPAPGQPQWASTSAAAKRRSEARHRRAAPAQPQASIGSRVMVPQGSPAGLRYQRGHGDPVPSGREPAAAPSRSPYRPVKPAVARGQQAPVSGQQPEWARRARPGSWPAEAPKPAPPAETPGKPRIIEVSHAEQAQPEKKATPAPSGDLLLPFSVAKPSPPAVVTGPARPYGPVRPELPGKHSRPVAVAQSRVEERPARTVEQVLGGPAGRRGRSWHERVTLVPGGHGPGRPGPADQEERDKARARLPLPGPRRVVVLGCTSGAGQTVMTLLVARLLASLRGEPVGVLDLNPGEGSLVQRAKSGVAGSVHDLLNGMSPAGPGLELIGGGEGPAGVKGLDERDFGRIGDLLAQRYAISLVDPGASAVGRVLAIADQLVLVAPASSDAPRAVSMTREWLEAHDHRGLAANAIMVLNGVSGRSMADVESAEAIVVGRCRAIVRVPWEDQLGGEDGPCAGVAPLRLRARQALTALAGVLVSGLAAGAEVSR
jgi:MinD-like ATPase involved in chromosome partitioning or flagellar assembly